MITIVFKKGNQYCFKKGYVPWCKGKHTWDTRQHPKPMLGKHHTEETKNKISKMAKERMKNPEYRKHMSEVHKGKKLSEETKRKMSDVRKGKPKNEEWKRKMSELLRGEKNPMFGIHKFGKNAPYFGKRHSEETKIKMGLKRKLEKNANWLGGKSFEPHGIEFNKTLKEKIRKRDNYTCQECGYTQEQLKYKLPIHHIDYDKKNNKPENLVSLCRTCHAQTNFCRGNWLTYYQNKVFGGG